MCPQSIFFLSTERTWWASNQNRLFISICSRCHGNRFFSFWGILGWFWGLKNYVTKSTISSLTLLEKNNKYFKYHPCVIFRNVIFTSGSISISTSCEGRTQKWETKKKNAIGEHCNGRCECTLLFLYYIITHLIQIQFIQIVLDK